MAIDVMGRDCSRWSASPSYAHSMSCGAPEVARCLPRQCGHGTHFPVGEHRRAAGDVRWRAMMAPPRSTWYVSASLSPETSAVPRPGTALTTATPRRPLTGSALKPTPAHRAVDHALHEHSGRRRRQPKTVLPAVLQDPTAEAGSPDRGDTRSDRRARSTFSTLSSCPANECAAPSSSLAEDRTATCPRSPASASKARSSDARTGADGCAEPMSATISSSRRARVEPPRVPRRPGWTRSVGRQDEPTRYGKPGTRRFGERARLAAHRRSSQRVGRSQDVAHGALHESTSAGTAPRLRYISSVHTPDMISRRLPAPARLLRRNVTATAIHPAINAASSHPNGHRDANLSCRLPGAQRRRANGQQPRLDGGRPPPQRASRSRPRALRPGARGSCARSRRPRRWRSSPAETRQGHAAARCGRPRASRTPWRKRSISGMIAMCDAM